MQVRKEDLAAAIRYQEGAVQGVQQARNQLEGRDPAWLLIHDHVPGQLALRWRSIRPKTPLCLGPEVGSERMLAKGLGGVNGKCVPLCTMMEMNCRKFAL